MLVVVCMIVIVAGIAMLGMAVRTRCTGHMRIVVCMAVIVIVIVVMVVAARGSLAVRVLAGRRRRIGDGGRIRIVRVGAARSGAAGMTVSWVVGTLGVGHDNLLNG
ncbi:hypothetical protein [Burkholderia lata]|uniref:hypothetical protein n=1 Tax=Burkholderia lata (strain ATCC 17760 / DSM 23089 / LMG 22485 / NCIMB 9086 / R18194 / 383) TaxID=482957 RepID=UPI00242AED31|nr:hypothetical protein [Burkholderia lata]